MAEKAQTSANVSNGTAPARPAVKKQDSDKDLDDYFVRDTTRLPSLGIRC